MTRFAEHKPRAHSNSNEFNQEIALIGVDHLPNNGLCRIAEKRDIHRPKRNLSQGSPVVGLWA